MSFKNKLKNKRIIKFSSNKRKNLLNPTVLFLNEKFSSRLDNVFSTKLNTQRMLKVAFGLGHSKLLGLASKQSNEFSILNFLSKLELRAVNVIYNSGLGTSRAAIKQLISKRKIFVNGKKIKSNN
jgi:ribosomal protein S4